MTAPQQKTSRKLAVSIGGYFSPAFSVTSKLDKLVHTRAEPGHADGRRKVLTPSPEAWGRFAKALDELGVWGWRAKYFSNVLDGTQWSVEIALDGRRVRCDGSNCYPAESGEPSESTDITETFRRFLSAVSELAGGLEMG